MVSTGVEELDHPSRMAIAVQELEIVSNPGVVLRPDLLCFINRNVPPAAITPTWTADPTMKVKAARVRPPPNKE